MNTWIDIVPWAFFWIALFVFVWLYRRAEKKRVERFRAHLRQVEAYRSERFKALRKQHSSQE